jgi:CheY-like chemotaxis protein
MQPGTQGSPKILLATADLTLRHTRTHLLRSFGFEVSASESKLHAIEMFQSGTFDVLVLGNTLNATACRELGKAFRRFQPRGRVIEILDASNFQPKNNPDATVAVLSGPLALRDVIQSQLRSITGDGNSA